MSRRHSTFNKLKLIFLVILFIFIFALLLGIREFMSIQNSIKSGWFEAPNKFFTSPLEFRKGQIIGNKEVMDLFKKVGLQERGFQQSLGVKEFTLVPFFECSKRLSSQILDETRSCIIVQTTERKTSLLELSNTKILRITEITSDETREVTTLLTRPLLFAQWSQGKPALRTQVTLSQIPRYCIDGVLAIEDDRFLNHRGISIKGILRAALVNLKSGRLSQGGSTLTQQLIKNKYLTAEKSLSRKAREAFMALLIELLLDKDEILEAYLNYIYWGQRGPYTVYGIEEASQHYFNKNVGKLGLAECSLLAAAIKGPGIYGPHRKENSKKRQKDVLNRMRELQLITTKEFDQALNKYVPVTSRSKDKLLAPYYLNSVHHWLEKNKLLLKGLNIYTELDFFAQRALEKRLDKFLKGRSQGFQGSYILAQNSTNSIIALASGKSNSLNYNSALFAKRHIGSLAKPFVYLNAFLENDESDEVVLTPETPLSNESFTYKYEGQSWTPKNYSRKNSQQEYPLYQALAKSVNIPAIRAMSMAGHKSLHKLLIKYGFEKPIPLVPSIALGGFEQSPFHVLKAYVSLASGSSQSQSSPQFVRRVLDSEGKTLYERKELSLSDESTFSIQERIILEMLKGTLKFGTARRSQNYKLQGVYAGKTGTSNKHRDAWFASLSPDYTSVVWMGKADYLTEKGIKLTGASAALPVWLEVTQELEKEGRLSYQDWPIPEELEYREVPLPGSEDSFFPLLFESSNAY